MDAQAAALAAAPPPMRRAPLAALDVNAAASPPPTAGLKDAVSSTVAARRASPGPLGGGARDSMAKRPADDADASPAAKRACLARDEQQPSRSHSPDASSVFDTSVADVSWATVATTVTAPEEPDLVDGAAPRAQRLTREQAREKVEILRLRLGLASYKLRTGQTAVPLADLQPRPLPPRRAVRVQSPRRPSSPESESEPSSMPRRRPQNPASSLLRHPPLGADAMPRGGAVSGLLSLARSCDMR